MHIWRFLLSLAMSTIIAASVHAADYIPPMPDDFNQVDFYLQTVGDGEEVYMAFGHSLVRVMDHKAGTDVVFNWGVFDFSDPNFLFDFVYGAINYRMAAYNMQSTLMTYKYERRTLVQEKINLTEQQKKILMEKIIWSSQPENLFFPYHYYFTNCSTKVRDHLNLALGDQIAKRFVDMPGAESLRNAIRGHFLDFPFIGTYTEILMNGDLERQMTAWQEMFLPGRLQKYLQQLPAFDDNGNPMALPLLSEKVELLHYDPPPPAPLNGFQIFFFAAVPLLLIIGLMLLLAPHTGPVAFRLLGCVAIGWGIFSGFFGLAMTIIWAFFVHVHGKHSANLWILWPLDFIWVWCGIKWLRTGAPIALGKQALIPWFNILHLVAMVITLGLYLTGLITQDISNILYYLAPISALLAVLSLRFGFRKRIAS